MYERVNKLLLLLLLDLSVNFNFKKIKEIIP